MTHHMIQVKKKFVMFRLNEILAALHVYLSYNL